MIPIAEHWFNVQPLHPRLVWITEPFYWQWNRANVWLIRGRDRDLLLDAGTGVADLRAALVDRINKPLLAVASHVHFDHAGGLAAFADVAIHAAEAAALADADPVMTLSDPAMGWILDEHFTRQPVGDSGPPTTVSGRLFPAVCWRMATCWIWETGNWR